MRKKAEGKKGKTRLKTEGGEGRRLKAVGRRLKAEGRGRKAEEKKGNKTDAKN